MAKKRAKDSKITIDFTPKSCDDESIKPKCFGKWALYCNPDLCGQKCYEDCKKQEEKYD